VSIDFAKPDNAVEVVFDNLHIGTTFWDKSDNAWTKISSGEARTVKEPYRSKPFAKRTNVCVTQQVASRPKRIDPPPPDPDEEAYRELCKFPDRVILELIRSQATDPEGRKKAQEKLRKMLPLFEKYGQFEEEN